MPSIWDNCLLTHLFIDASAIPGYWYFLRHFHMEYKDRFLVIFSDRVLLLKYYKVILEPWRCWQLTKPLNIRVFSTYLSTFSLFKETFWAWLPPANSTAFLPIHPAVITRKTLPVYANYWVFTGSVFWLFGEFLCLVSPLTPSTKVVLYESLFCVWQAPQQQRGRSSDSAHGNHTLQQGAAVAFSAALQHWRTTTASQGAHSLAKPFLTASGLLCLVICTIIMATVRCLLTISLIFNKILNTLCRWQNAVTAMKCPLEEGCSQMPPVL